MAVKDQCSQCKNYKNPNCVILIQNPEYNGISCESYQKRGINLEKHEETVIIPQQKETCPSANENQTHNNYNSNPPKMFQHPFSFEGRIRRTEYGVVCIIGNLFNVIMDAVPDEAAGIFLIIFIPFFWLILAEGTKRCHDLGHNGWWQLILFYGFWLLFQEGDKQDNEYGCSPK